MKQIFGFITGFAIITMLIGCQNSSSDNFPKIRYGRDICAECHMIISEESYASALITPGGQIRKFDGVGCLMKYMKNNPGINQKIWVHDFEKQIWIDGESAFFVRQEAVPTPMGDGLLAFFNRGAAEIQAKNNQGTILTFDELLQKP